MAELYIKQDQDDQTEYKIIEKSRVKEYMGSGCTHHSTRRIVVCLVHEDMILGKFTDEQRERLDNGEELQIELTVKE